MVTLCCRYTVSALQYTVGREATWCKCQSPMAQTPELLESQGRAEVETSRDSGTRDTHFESVCHVLCGITCLTLLV